MAVLLRGLENPALDRYDNGLGSRTGNEGNLSLFHYGDHCHGGTTSGGANYGQYLVLGNQFFGRRHGLGWITDRVLNDNL